MSKRKAALVERSAKRVPPWARGVYRERLERLRTLVPKSVLYHKPTKRHQRNIAELDAYLFGGGEDKPRAYSKDKRLYRAKRYDRLSVAQAFTHLPEQFHGMMNVALVPNLGKGTRYSFTSSGDLKIRNQHIERTFKPFDYDVILQVAQGIEQYKEKDDREALAQIERGVYDDAWMYAFIQHVGDLTEDDPPDTLYQLNVGNDHAFGGWGPRGSMGREQLIKTLVQMFMMYSDDIHKWINGVIIYQFRDQHRATGFDDPEKIAALGRVLKKKRRRKPKGKR